MQEIQQIVVIGVDNLVFTEHGLLPYDLAVWFKEEMRQQLREN